MEDFYDSELAAQMVAEYAKCHSEPKVRNLCDIDKLLKDTELLEKQIKSTHSFLMRRRRARLELKLMRSLLEILLSLSPADQQLGKQIYDRLVSSVDRLEKLC